MPMLENVSDAVAPLAAASLLVKLEAAAADAVAPIEPMA
jgi:hypothetical protein